MCYRRPPRCEPPPPEPRDEPPPRDPPNDPPEFLDGDELPQELLLRVDVLLLRPRFMFVVPYEPRLVVVDGVAD